MKPRIINKKDSPLMRFIGFFYPSFMRFFWTTYRLPFQKQATIASPVGISNPKDDRYKQIIEHEMVHVEQFSSWYGPFLVLFLYVLFPFPVIFSGRWFVERNAYLVDIKNERIFVEDAVYLLWVHYFCCWPRFLMRRWFNKRIVSE